MPSPSRTLPLVTLGLALMFSGSEASSRPAADGLGLAGVEVLSVKQNDAEIQRTLTRSATWQEFQSRHGAWRAIWNEATGTPHRAFGRGIALEGFVASPGGVDRSLRAFIADNPGLFAGSPDLVTAHIEQHGNVWYARYRQVVDGIPVLFSDWEFRISPDGRLFTFGADARRVPLEAVHGPRLVGAVAREAAKTGLSFDPSHDRVDGGSELVLVPIKKGGAADFRLAYRTQVEMYHPRASWTTLVDAADGKILWRNNRIRNANITGTVTARVHPNVVTDALASRNLPYLYVVVGPGQDDTNSLGQYSVVCTATSNVTAELSGLYCHVKRLDCLDLTCEDAHFGASTTCGSVRNITWDLSNSQDSERDAYYHAMRAHDYLKVLDANYTANDADIQLEVNDPDGECNAFYDPDGNTITFAIAAAGCPNMASVPDMVYHEYCHYVNARLYLQQGVTDGLVNGALDEGTCDIFAAFLTDDPTIGEGFYGTGTNWRVIANTNKFPEDESSDGHVTGMILGGAYWDLRQSLGLATAQHLYHWAKYGVPDDDDDGVAMSEYFIETLVADDTDADITNGTPHFTEILNAFNAHKIGSIGFLNIAHGPLEDQSTNGPYPVTALIVYTGPIGGLDNNTPRLFYSINGTPYASRPMFPTGNPDEWGSEITPSSGGVIKYYIQAGDAYGVTKTEPPAAPARRVFTFVGGPASALLSANMEVNPGWSTTAAGDDATSGVWIRAVPVGTVVQPDEDHTPAGTICYLTGNGPVDEVPSYNDVDDGKTTLTTTAFDATPAGIYGMISYYRWYTNNGGEAPSEDFWHVDISNNGGASWVTVENTNETDESWRRVLFFIKDYVTPTNNMKLRFIAQDYGLGSLVEAAVDDLDLLGFPPTVTVGGDVPALSFALSPAAPNPFTARTMLSYTLPTAGKVSLGVFDINGRAVKSLMSGDQTAGPHTIEWDGRDGAGRRVAAGPYFLKLTQNGQKTTRAVVRVP